MWSELIFLGIGVGLTLLVSSVRHSWSEKSVLTDSYARFIETCELAAGWVEMDDVERTGLLDILKSVKITAQAVMLREQNSEFRNSVEDMAEYLWNRMYNEDTFKLAVIYESTELLTKAVRQRNSGRFSIEVPDTSVGIIETTEKLHMKAKEARG